MCEHNRFFSQYSSKISNMILINDGNFSFEQRPEDSFFSPLLMISNVNDDMAKTLQMKRNVLFEF